MVTCPSQVIENIRVVVDYLWDDERRNFDGLPDENHIFKSLAIVARWLAALETNPIN